MMKTTELWTLLGRFRAKKAGTTIEEFIDFIEEEQSKSKKGGIVSADEREVYRKLKEIKRRQEEIALPDPDKEYNSLK